MTRLEQMQNQLQKKQREFYELSAKQSALGARITSLNMKLSYSTDPAWINKANKTLQRYAKDYSRMQSRLQVLNGEIATLRYNMGMQ